MACVKIFRRPAPKVGRHRRVGLGREPRAGLSGNGQGRGCAARDFVRPFAAGQNGFVGRRAGHALCRRHRELLRRNGRGAVAARLRRNGGRHRETFSVLDVRQLPKICQPLGQVAGGLAFSDFAHRAASAVFEHRQRGPLGDPHGEFLAARAATPVYKLLGKTGILETNFPPLDQAAPARLRFQLSYRETRRAAGGLGRISWTLPTCIFRRQIGNYYVIAARQMPRRCLTTDNNSPTNLMIEFMHKNTHLSIA